jgi:hypothetical protein
LPRYLRSMSIVLCSQFRLNEITFLTMATFRLLPYFVTTFSQSSSPSWRMINQFKTQNYCHNQINTPLFINILHTTTTSTSKDYCSSKILHSLIKIKVS